MPREADQLQDTSKIDSRKEQNTVPSLSAPLPLAIVRERDSVSFIVCFLQIDVNIRKL